MRHRCYWPALPDCTAGDSERQIYDLDPLVAVDDAFAPDGVKIGEWLFRDGFLGKLSYGLQFLNAIPRASERILSTAAIVPVIVPPVPGSM